jgi:aerobic carbon-monoxide dehydrogenase large subunit
MTRRTRLIADTSIGASVKRVEDGRLLTGRGLYADDLHPRDVAYAAVLRSPHAHAVIRSIDVSNALSAPDVLLILTGEDVLREKVAGLPCVWTPPMTVGTPFIPEQPLLAIGKVRLFRILGNWLLNH